MPERISLLIPALDEESAIATTLAGLAGQELHEVIVIDNGSTDATAAEARAHGARVVQEPRRGYGYACLAGMAAVDPATTIVAFMDADGSDDPGDLPRLVEPLAQGRADLVLGSRMAGAPEKGSLTPQQRFGNWLATSLARLLYGARYTDLGPFRAIRRDALQRLGMRDAGFGWTIEMQIKAHEKKLRVLEIPVSYRKRRGGRSKISGTLRGTLLAGAKIVWTILRYRFSNRERS